MPGRRSSATLESDARSTAARHPCLLDPTPTSSVNAQAFSGETHALSGELAPTAIARSTDPNRFERLTLASGIASSVVFLAGFLLFVTLIVPSMPPLGAPAAQSTAFYAEMSRNAIYRSISYLGELQMMLLLPFFAGLLVQLRRAEGGSGALSL